jgi:toxin ParE1/3/4
MRSIQLTARAERDIDQIADYTMQRWGESQTDRYLTQLEDTFAMLAENPGAGRPAAHISPGLRRFEVGKHVIFFQKVTPGIRILRVLHQQMLPVRKHFDRG